MLGLGGNVGDVAATMRAALASLAATGEVKLVSVSSLWATPPWGRTDQPDFLNAVAEISTVLSPRALLERALAVEHDSRRVRGERWGPRTLDIDILLFGDRAIDEEGLHVPHPRIGERAFVTIPMAEIAPDIAARFPVPERPAGMAVAAGKGWWTG